MLAAVAGYTFMEMAARITIVSGRSLGYILQSGRWLPAILFAAVWFGCAAYQAGNLAGALGGIQLIVPVGRPVILLLVALIGFLLYRARTLGIARVMAGVVAVMGTVFVVAAAIVLFTGVVLVEPPPPEDNLILGLIGTTIVPYNFFLAAGLGAEGKLGDMRWGLGTSFAFGGVITSAILIIGSTVPEFLNFGDLAATLERTLGPAGRQVLAIGLFCAGFSSATTAPLAAAMAGRELLSWSGGGKAYTAAWVLVLVAGTLVALWQIDIVGIILGAQIVNGLLLPAIALLVLVLANRVSLLGGATNRWYQNVLGVGVLIYLLYRTALFFAGLFV